MHRRTFIKTASGVVAGAGVGSASAESEPEPKGDPIVSHLEIRDQISDGERGAMCVVGDVSRLPDEYLQAEILLQFRDECGDIVVEMQEADENPGDGKWSFVQSWFATADRVESVQTITAILNVHQDGAY